MSPTRRLTSVGAGCTFDWVSDEVADEARAVLALDRLAVPDLNALIDLLRRGVLRSGRDYKQMQRVTDDPPVFELRVETTRPKLRLYFIEESHHDGVHALGLLLACKPLGTLDAVRIQQNEDVDRAKARRPSV